MTRYQPLPLLAILAVVLGSVPCVSHGKGAMPVPAPKHITWFDSPPLELASETTVIVLGKEATAPERYAADRLAAQVKKRFGQDWVITTEDRVPASAEVLFLLGQRSTHGKLDELCRSRQIELSDNSPGFDGYVIEVAQTGEVVSVVVGGSNARGVIYGQDTLFQLLTGEKESLRLTRASIRDWPSVKWRGRPQTHYELYLEPGELDCYMVSRINFIDLRDSIYAFEPGADLDKPRLEQVVHEAHRRGLIVFGTLNCGVPKDEHDEVIETLTEFIELGVDGLWFSFDDKGAGEDADSILARVLRLAADHGISGSRLAVCPPKGSYQEIQTPFMAKLLARPEFAEALVFYTLPPSEANRSAYQAMGPTVKPSWWHNWPRLNSGFTHYESKILRPEGEFSYGEIPPMTEGWHAPEYGDLVGGDEYIDAVMPWGGQRWGRYYIVPQIGWWGWDPDQHDWDAVRRRIFDIVYGPGQVDDLMVMEDRLVALKSLFFYSWPKWKDTPFCPARLADPADRSQALKLIDEMDVLYRRIKTSAPEETLLPEPNVWAPYLDAMKNELAVARSSATLDYPEYWWLPHQERVFDALYAGDLETADKLTASVRDRIKTNVAKVGEEIGHLTHVPGYVTWWQERAELDGKGWQRMLVDRRKALAERVEWFAYTTARIDRMMTEAGNPPWDWGTGRWRRVNRRLATAVPGEEEQFWGEWMGGLHRQEGTTSAVFAFAPHVYSVPGMFSELPMDVPIGKERERLALLTYLGNVDKEEIGAHYARSRWAGHRKVRLLWEDRVLWEADLGVRREPGEWFMIRLPEIPAGVDTLHLRLRVDEIRETHSGKAIALVGPFHLVQLPGGRR